MKKLISAVMIIMFVGAGPCARPNPQGDHRGSPLHAAPYDALRQRAVAEDPSSAAAVGAMFGASANAAASAEEYANELMVWAKLQIGQGISEAEFGRLLAERTLAEPEHVDACRRVAEGLGGDVLAVFEELTATASLTGLPVAALEPRQDQAYTLLQKQI